MEPDILHEILDDDLSHLRDFYLNHIPHASHIVSFFTQAMKWKRVSPDNKYITILIPNGDWRSHGTFIAILQFSCYDLYIFTMEKSCNSLFEGLTKTKRIDWTKKILFNTLHANHYQIVRESLRYLNIDIDYEKKTDFWYLPKEKACQLTYECPSGYYIKRLNPEDVETINEVWAHKYPGSKQYLQTYIEMNGGHGIYKKNDNQLVAWCLKILGLLGVLQTCDEFKKRGLGTLVTKSLCKEVGLEGDDPIASVLVTNVASQNTFKKIGFQIIDRCYFIETCGYSRTNFE